MANSDALTIKTALKSSDYPGRGIIVGTSRKGKYAVCAYIVTGRSDKAKNTVLLKENECIYSRLAKQDVGVDKAFTVFRAVAQVNNNLIITNGDHTDTVTEYLSSGKDYYNAMMSRSFEIDEPHFTSRIGAMLTFEKNSAHFVLSIIKAKDKTGKESKHEFFEYEQESGIGHYIHTYKQNTNPLPSFDGDPLKLKIPESIDRFANKVWKALDDSNKISLYVRYTDLISGEINEKIINKYE